jgi:LAGLIDADG DNA endonuclease family
MDDGYKSGKGLYICTESFSLEEIKILIVVLKNKFNLEYNYHRVTNDYRIYIFGKSKDTLVKLVKPYL